ncbi:AraC family transcriptional regulator [Apibacter sp. HY039]|uniref:AraC family transcriptional regulator n=1 Tax=Apibacter sp. HY039 TaxID=2501476 RepID=UPI000FEBB9B3|nr:AraC family transcriptional regulator [Apibacter sp. HY039]
MRELSKREYSGNKIYELVTDAYSCSVTTYTPSSFDTSRHYHPNAHLSFVLRGGCLEKKKNTYSRNPGKTIYYDPGEHHQICEMADESIHVNIDFENHFFSEDLTFEDIRMTCNSDPSLSLTLIKLYHELYVQDNLSAAGIELLILSIFYKNHQILNLKNKPEWIYEIKDYLHDTWDKPLCLETISDLFSVHKVTVSKYFTHYFGCTPSEYLRILKIQKATSLIIHTSQSLTDIAFECGFSDQSHFVRTFKSYTGFIPKKFRQV